MGGNSTSASWASFLERAQRTSTSRAFFLTVLGARRVDEVSGVGLDQVAAIATRGPVREMHRDELAPFRAQHERKLRGKHNA